MLQASHTPGRQKRRRAAGRRSQAPRRTGRPARAPVTTSPFITVFSSLMFHHPFIYSPVRREQRRPFRCRASVIPDADFLAPPVISRTSDDGADIYVASFIFCVLFCLFYFFAFYPFTLSCFPAFLLSGSARSFSLTFVFCVCALPFFYFLYS
ncbi:hypothetical protein [Klebsiella michiganensis]|uniref:hypothetical protein n=1 Tax=Klebsiella michiganensis TaxID=1134687 RepID=UPI003F507BC1